MIYRTIIFLKYKNQLQQVKRIELLNINYATD